MIICLTPSINSIKKLFTKKPYDPHLINIIFILSILDDTTENVKAGKYRISNYNLDLWMSSIKQSTDIKNLYLQMLKDEELIEGDPLRITLKYVELKNNGGYFKRWETKNYEFKKLKYDVINAQWNIPLIVLSNLIALISLAIAVLAYVGDSKQQDSTIKMQQRLEYLEKKVSEQK